MPRSFAILLAFALACAHSRTSSPTRARTTMVHITGGSFAMGTDSAEVPALLERYHSDYPGLFDAEIPRRIVQVSDFWLDRTEVTNAAYREFVRRVPAWRKDSVPAARTNGRYLEDWTGDEFPSGAGARPVAFVTWTSAQAYCTWKGGRLPTEAEWEYAARGGLANAEFPWGNDPPDSARANWGGSKVGHTVDVASYPPNGYGLFDMVGNVWEFTSDAWPVDAAAPITLGGRYVIRGGSYGAAAVNLRIRYRDSHPAGAPGPHVGFRCARSSSPGEATRTTAASQPLAGR